MKGFFITAGLKNKMKELLIKNSTTKATINQMLIPGPPLLTCGIIVLPFRANFTLYTAGKKVYLKKKRLNFIHRYV